MRIDFYVLEPGSSSGRLKLACRGVEKAYTSGHSGYLRARDDAEARTLDDLLWTFSQSSFVPHSCGYDDKTDAPVRISHLAPSPEQAEIVVSVADEPVADYSSSVSYTHLRAHET